MQVLDRTGVRRLRLRFRVRRVRVLPYLQHQSCPPVTPHLLP
ncbi:unnamed protein product [Chondrus crispus]|uniref:Uncharacterized protein n=1 Tax=Chondrus crispus TaxID=2769 RepID=R7Q0A4_CHOCR|nr:unnamed protein product [Chondrus crispus]CDF32077.1 unnamed protein product [Chondrus crispus]|eukprot:XP_005711742.1 unnamed protein product [Chondrus crispus]